MPCVLGDLARFEFTIGHVLAGGRVVRRAADPVPNDKLAGATQPPGPPTVRRPPIGGSNVFITRLHVRYDAAHLPEDLMFRRRLTAPASRADISCAIPTPARPAARPPRITADPWYRVEREAATLAGLTGWDFASICAKMKASGQGAK